MTDAEDVDLDISIALINWLYHISSHLVIYVTTSPSF